MPPLGTKEWVTWLGAQPPAVQSQWMEALGMQQTNQQPSLGMQQANQQPSSATVGGFSPALSQGSYDMTGALAAPVDLNTKGKQVPFDVNTLATSTNAVQDRNSQLTDPITAMLAGTGSYDANAFTPTQTGTGAPITPSGANSLAAYSQGGGYQGFMSSLMLPKAMGGQGMSPSAAKSALLSFVMAPATATATPEEAQQRADVLASLPTKSPSDPDPNHVGAFLPRKADYSSPEGIAASVDTGAIDKWSTDQFDALMKDVPVGFQDPKTGLSYAGSTSTPTAQQDFFDKAGLPYPTASYTDPARMTSFEDAMTGTTDPNLPGPDGSQSRNDQWLHQRELAAKGQTDTQSAMDSSQALIDAFTAAVNQGGSRRTDTTPPDENAMMQHALAQAKATGRSFADFMPQVDQQRTAAANTPPAWSANAAMPTVNEFGMLAKPSEMLDFRKGGLSDFVPIPAKGLRKATSNDLKNAQGNNANATANKNRADTAARNAQSIPDDIMQRMLAGGKLINLANQGRTPMQDAIAQRMLAIRNQGLTGY